MVGKVSFYYWSETDNAGNKSYNVFLAVALLMLIFGLGIAFEAISEA
jgi:hypothetical protein